MTDTHPIPGYEGLYSITRDGKLWSHPKAPPPGKRGRKHDGRWMSPSFNKHLNTHQVELSRDGVKRNFTVKRLVRLAWGEKHGD